MGVKFNREYKEIVHDLAAAIGRIENSYEAFEMTAEEWNAQEAPEQAECMRTLADDVFYGLGTSPSLEVGSGKIEYDAGNHLIKVRTQDNVVHLIKLI